MEATKENLKAIKEELVFDIIFIKERFYDDLDDEEMEQLESELEAKIMKMLPSYKETISPTAAFSDILERTAENFVKKIKANSA